MPSKSFTGTLALLAGLPLLLSAGTITFFDTSGTATYADGTGRAPNLNCTTIAEACFGSLVAPNGLFAQGGGRAIFVMQPGTDFISDKVTSGPGLTSVFLNFAGGENGSLGTCSSHPTGCGLTEDGTIQTAFTLDWVDSVGNILATDTIKFQSVSQGAGAPEPSTFPLLIIGGAALIGTVKLRAKLMPRP